MTPPPIAAEHCSRCGCHTPRWWRADDGAAPRRSARRRRRFHGRRHPPPCRGSHPWLPNGRGGAQRHRGARPRRRALPRPDPARRVPPRPHRPRGAAPPARRGKLGGRHHDHRRARTRHGQHGPTRRSRRLPDQAVRIFCAARQAARVRRADERTRRRQRRRPVPRRHAVRRRKARPQRDAAEGSQRRDRPRRARDRPSTR